MPAKHVKAYIKRNKNDAADAEAICEAVRRPTMRFVQVKSVDQQAQLMQTLYGLGETLNVITTRLDEQSTVTRKAFADQKLLIDNVAETTRILREKADDTNVRLSNVSQELQALRQTIASMPPATAVVPSATGDPGTVDPNAPPATGSDAYATAFTTFVLAQAGVPSSHAGMSRALAWLRSHQNPATGAWPAVSMNKKRPAGSMEALFMQDAATAFASIALVERAQ